MNLKRGLLSAILLLLVPASTALAQADDPLFNHKPPAAWPDWFVPSGSFGVTAWIHSDERNLLGGERPDYGEYRARSKLSQDALVALVRQFAESHHFANIDVIDPHKKVVASELREDDPAAFQKALSQHHNYIIAIEATDGGFELSLSQGAL